MSDKHKSSDKSKTETTRNNERPFRESVVPGRREHSVDFSVPPLTVTERNPVPTDPPKRKGK